MPNSVSKLGLGLALPWKGAHQDYSNDTICKFQVDFPYYGLRLILVYPNRQKEEADLTLTYRHGVSLELSCLARFYGSDKTHAY